MRDHSQHQFSSTGDKLSGTIKPTPNFNAVADAKTLYKAMKGFGTDEDSIIGVLGRRTCYERQEIKDVFKANYGKDLVEELISELNGDFCEMIVMLMRNWDEMLAKVLYDAIAGAGTNEEDIVQVLCTLSNSEMESVKKAYSAVLMNEGVSDSSRNLENDITCDMSGHAEQLMVALLQAKRADVTSSQAASISQRGIVNVVDMNLVKQDCEEVYVAGEGKRGTDEEVLIRILASRSKYHIRALADAYENKYKTKLIDAIDSETSGTFNAAATLVVRYLLDQVSCFAYLLKQAMDGLGTCDSMLMRIVISRSEIDMVQIKQAFEKETGQTLAEWIKNETSSDYQQLLLNCIGEPWK